jgi:hypothetical protein
MRRWLQGRTGIVLFSLGTLFGCASTGGETSKNILSIQRLAPYKDTTLVREAIREKCMLEERVPKWVRQYTDYKYDDVVLIDDVSPKMKGSVMKLEILGAEGRSGGIFSGQKSLTISGTLWKDGVVAGSFIASRATAGGILKARTCGLLIRTAKRIGKDVGNWIEKPTMNAKLGFREERSERAGNDKGDGEEEEK